MRANSHTCLHTHFKHKFVVSTTVGGGRLHKKEPIRILFFSFGAQDETRTHTPFGIRTSSVRVYHSTTWAGVFCSQDESKLTYLFAYALQAFVYRFHHLGTNFYFQTDIILKIARYSYCIGFLRKSRFFYIFLFVVTILFSPKTSRVVLLESTFQDIFSFLYLLDGTTQRSRNIFLYIFRDGFCEHGWFRKWFFDKHFWRYLSTTFWKYPHTNKIKE